MGIVRSKEEVAKILATKKNAKKPILFEKEIKSLKKGEAFEINVSEWELRTTPSAYYYGKYRKGKTEKYISCNKVGEKYLIVKL